MCTLSVLNVSWVTVLPGLAQSQRPTSESTLIQFAPPPLSDRDRPPGRSSGGASRGQCNFGATEYYFLTALVPATQVMTEEASDPATRPNLRDLDVASSYESVFSFTTAAHPSFWFHVPYVLDEELTLEFVLQDENSHTVYQTQFQGSDASAGIIQFALPETAPELAIDQPYQWYLLAHCGEEALGEPSYVQGWMVRTSIDADLQAQIANVSELEKASLYAANGIWQEALTTLGELYRADPQNTLLKQNWVNLLASVGLDSVAEEPLIECCR